jgi:ParB-like chromosome segregation protein Spo0J
MLQDGQLGMGQARAIAGITDAHRQLSIARLAARRNLSVRQVEELARSAPDSDGPAGDVPTVEDESRQRHLGDVEQSLSRDIGLPVRLYPGRKKNSGRIVISYNSLEEFDHVAERLGGAARLE